jgi:hypothetical protein
LGTPVSSTDKTDHHDITKILLKVVFSTTSIILIPLNFFQYFRRKFSSHLIVCLFVCFMVLNTTFNNILVISWWSVLSVEETGVLGENHQPAKNNQMTRKLETKILKEV